MCCVYNNFLQQTGSSLEELSDQYSLSEDLSKFNHFSQHFNLKMDRLYGFAWNLYF